MTKNSGSSRHLSIDKWWRYPGVYDADHTKEASTGSLITRGRCEGKGFKIKWTKVLWFSQVGLNQSECRRGDAEGGTGAKWESENNRNRQESRERVRDGIRCSDKRRQKLLGPLDVSLFYRVYKANRSQCSLASAYHRKTEWNADVSAHRIPLIMWTNLKYTGKK